MPAETNSKPLLLRQLSVSRVPFAVKSHRRVAHWNNGTSCVTSVAEVVKNTKETIQGVIGSK